MCAAVPLAPNSSPLAPTVCADPWAYALSLIIGGLFFAGRMRESGFTTMLDLFELRFGHRVSVGLFVAAALGELFWSAAILTALGTTLSTLLGLDFTTAVLASAAIAIGYTTMGGLQSVAKTDVFQLLCILAGLCLALPFLMDTAGGWSRVVAAYRHDFGDAASLWPSSAAFTGGGARWGWLWLDSALLLVFGGIPWQVYFQRVLACRDAATSVRLSVLAGFGCLFMAIPALLIGAIGATLDWASLPVPEPGNPALVLPYLLRYLTPPLVAALGLGAVAAAVMSSVDSSILSASSMFVWNVWRPARRRELSGGEVSRRLRRTIVVVGACAALLALSVGSVYTLWFLCSDLVYVVLFPQLVAGLFFKNANRNGSIAGAAVGLVLRLGGGEPLLGLPALIPYPMQHPEMGVLFPFKTFSMLTGLGTIWLVSALRFPRSTSRVPNPDYARTVVRC